MTDAERLQAEIAEVQAALAAKKAIETGEPAPSSMEFLTKARLMSQGATLGFADEIIARIRSMSPDVTYDEAVSEERDIIKQSRKLFPKTAIAYELGGALVPGLLAAPFTGGASLAPAAARGAALTTARVSPTVLRAAGVGAVEGGLYSVGTSDEKDPTLGGVLSDAATGAVVNPAAQKVVQLAGAGIKTLIRPLFKGRKSARAVEDEVMRIVSATGEPVEVIIDRVRKGEIIPDMSDVVTEELRAIYAKGGKGAQLINDKLRKRSETLRDATMTQLQGDLAPGVPSGNVLMAIKQNADELEAAAGAEYRRIYNESVPMGSNSVTAVSSTVRDALQDFTQLRSMVNGILKAKRLPPVFSVENKQVEILRPLDLETVEVIRRALKDRVKQSYDSGNKTLAKALDNREKELRGFIDEYSPELAATRAKWASIQSVKDAFNAGQKIFSMKADEAELFFEDIVNDPKMTAEQIQDVVAGLRAGVASGLRAKGGKGSRQSLVMKLDDIRADERAILEKIYPDESLDEIVAQINRSRQAFTTENRTLRGSQTAFTEEAGTRLGSAGAASDIAELITAGPMGKTLAAIRLVRRGLGAQSDMLSEDQYEKVAKMLVEENADLLEAAFTNRISNEALAENLSKWINRTASTIGAGATQQAVQRDLTIGGILSPAQAAASEAATPEAQAAYDGVEVPTMQLDAEGATAALIKALRGTDAAAQVQEAAR
tara:strand:- start:8 stop:2161 length:2154 start_codon:yes stop_codon:yes gene_type:complete